MDVVVRGVCVVGVAVWVCLMLGTCSGADLVIRIPGDLSQQDGYYRLDYK